MIQESKRTFESSPLLQRKVSPVVDEPAREDLTTSTTATPTIEEGAPVAIVTEEPTRIDDVRMGKVEAEVERLVGAVGGLLSRLDAQDRAIDELKLKFA